MRWLTNIKLNSEVIVGVDETYAEAINHKEKFLMDKIISDPKATEKYTVEQLKEMGLKGVYIEE